MSRLFCCRASIMAEELGAPLMVGAPTGELHLGACTITAVSLKGHRSRSRAAPPLLNMGERAVGTGLRGEQKNCPHSKPWVIASHTLTQIVQR